MEVLSASNKVYILTYLKTFAQCLFFEKALVVALVFAACQMLPKIYCPIALSYFSKGICVSKICGATWSDSAL